MTPALAAPPSALPYRPRLVGILEALHRAFVPLNTVVAPALDVGLGSCISNPVTGYLLVLRTRGRRTGQLREAPLGYVILDGAIYCCAGFGESTAWYRNLLADPAVEVVLPGRTLTGRAVPVSDPGEWVRAYRALIASLGLVSRAAIGDIRRMDDVSLRSRHRAIPLVRITPTGVRAGPLDPGGRFWLVALAGWSLLAASLAQRLAHARRRRPAR